MRLNFSGVDEAAIREGVRRIGKVVREQIELYSALTGHAPGAARPPSRRPAPRARGGAGGAAATSSSSAAGRAASGAGPDRGMMAHEPRRRAEGRSVARAQPSR